jgi:exonuclease VII small subunit
MKLNSLDKVIDQADDQLKKYCKENALDFEATRKEIEYIIDPLEQNILLDFYLDYYNHVMKFYKL